MEEAVVRRELSDNFCLYNKNYDSLKGAKGWAQESLEKHASVRLPMFPGKTWSSNLTIVGQEGAPVHAEGAGGGQHSRPVVECDTEADLLGGKAARIPEVRRCLMW